MPSIHHFFLLFSKPKHWIEVRDCRPKNFYFFQSLNTEFRYAICDRQTFTFFVAGHTPFSHAIGDEKVKFCRRRHNRFQCFAAKKVKYFQSTITCAVFTFFFSFKTSLKYDFLKTKIQYFPVQIITQKLTSDDENQCFRIPTGPQKVFFIQNPIFQGLKSNFSHPDLPPKKWFLILKTDSDSFRAWYSF